MGHGLALEPHALYSLVDALQPAPPRKAKSPSMRGGAAASSSPAAQASWRATPQVPPRQRRPRQHMAASAMSMAASSLHLLAMLDKAQDAFFECQWLGLQAKRLLACTHVLDAETRDLSASSPAEAGRAGV